MVVNHPLTLDGLQRNAVRRFARLQRNAVRRFARKCACTHYLVFKEPDATPTPPRWLSWVVPSDRTASTRRRRVRFRGTFQGYYRRPGLSIPIRRAGDVGADRSGLRVRRRCLPERLAAFLFGLPERLAAFLLAGLAPNRRTPQF